MKYHGVTFPWWFGYFNWQRKLWRLFFCKRNCHLLDEVETYITQEEKEEGFYDHYLVCDACQLIISIDKIDRKYCKM